MPNSSTRVIVQYRPRTGRAPETRVASRIKWDGGGGILVYDENGKPAVRVPLSATEQLTLEAWPPDSTVAPSLQDGSLHAA